MTRQLIIAIAVLCNGAFVSADITLPAKAFQSRATNTSPVIVRSGRTLPVTTTGPRTVCENGVCRIVTAPPVCRNCGKVHGSTSQPRQAYEVRQPYQTRQTASVNQYQAACQRQANEQARRGRMGHLLPMRSGARFEGVGMSSNPNNVPTCTPRRGMRLVGDATARGRNGRYYRCRQWL